MRAVYYNKECEQTLEHVAAQYNVDKDKLWELYLSVSRSNYMQDLYDIARENEKELRGEQ